MTIYTQGYGEFITNEGDHDVIIFDVHMTYINCNIIHDAIV